MRRFIYPDGQATVSVPASSKVTVYTRGTATIQQLNGYTNQPSSVADLALVTNGVYTSSAFSSAATLVISAGASPVFYTVGVSPIVSELYSEKFQAAPVAVDTTGAVSADAMLGGIVTSSTAAAVAGTVPAGSVMEAASEFAVGDSFDWSIIVTGGTNDFTVTAATGHTLVGAAVVVHSTSGRFRTRKTATNTFITYRIA